MNIRDAHLPPVPAQTGVTHRRLDVTVSDNGVQQHPQVAAPQTEPAPVAAAVVQVVALDELLRILRRRATSCVDEGVSICTTFQHVSTCTASANHTVHAAGKCID